MLAGEEASEAHSGGVGVDDLPGQPGDIELRQIGLGRRHRAAQREAGQLAQPAQAARHRCGQRGQDEIAAPARMQEVELGDAPRIVEQPVGGAGLLGADHLVDAVVEEGDVGARARFEQLVQADDLLRAIVPELAVIGHRDAVPECSEAAG